MNYNLEMEKMMEEIPQGTELLLHTCCAPCSSACIERLSDCFKIIILYYNPNITDKNEFRWISMIRQPEFVTEKVFDDAKTALLKKKPQLDVSKARFMSYSEGLCVQIMHKGAYDDEPASIMKMKQFIADNGYVEDFSNGRYHHEIYLSDPRKTAPEKLKTVIRHPICLI